MPKDMVFVIDHWYELLKDDGLMVIEDVQGSHLAQPIIDQSAQFFVKMNAQIVGQNSYQG